jgi:predicted regulator of Ras-like GTPase activity (Roadblock/LC7/MglB family)
MQPSRNASCGQTASPLVTDGWALTAVFWQERACTMGVEPVEDLRGSLAFTTLTDVMQFLNTTGRTGELWVEGGPENHTSQVYFDSGNVYHAQEGTITGIDALVEIISWVEGTFIFFANKACPTVTIEVSLQNALVEAARRLDERRREIAEHDHKKAPQRLLSSFAESSGVLAAVLTARDGTPIASANPEEAVRMEELGTGLKALIDTIDGLGHAQGCQPFGGFFIEFDRFQLLCLSVATAVLVVVAPERAQLGVIRHKTQHLADALAKVLAE